jgi:TPP-dependent pyruvate/acetoin dehydrogenase alpha subunit
VNGGSIAALTFEQPWSTFAARLAHEPVTTFDAGVGQMQPTHEQLMWMYETMLVIRDFEETMVKVYLEGTLPPHIQKGLAFDIGGGLVPGEMHLAAGQEPVAVGVCAHLRPDDTVVGTHRPHHFAIAKGVPLDAMAAEVFGKVTGLGRGKGGHMHLFDPAHQFSCSGIIGASLPPACGAALAAKKLGTDRGAVAFFGDGAANQGSFHESLNLAGLWKLPVMFGVIAHLLVPGQGTFARGQALAQIDTE